MFCNYIMGISAYFSDGSTLRNVDLVRPALYVMVRCISVALCGRIYGLVFSDVNVGVC
jgi:hypothetical protein